MRFDYECYATGGPTTLVPCRILQSVITTMPSGVAQNISQGALLLLLNSIIGF
jgi:hypothetical protein